MKRRMPCELDSACRKSNVCRSSPTNLKPIMDINTLTGGKWQWIDGISIITKYTFLLNLINKILVYNGIKTWVLRTWTAESWWYTRPRSEGSVISVKNIIWRTAKLTYYSMFRWLQLINLSNLKKREREEGIRRSIVEYGSPQAGVASPSCERLPFPAALSVRRIPATVNPH